MSNAARKARKRAGVRFEREPKVGTPLAERSWFAGFVPGPVGTRHEGQPQRRSEKKRARALAARGVKEQEQ